MGRARSDAAPVKLISGSHSEWFYQRAHGVDGCRGGIPMEARLHGCAALADELAKLRMTADEEAVFQERLQHY